MLTKLILRFEGEYIHNNPVSAMIVAKPEDYSFSSAIDYADGKGLVNVTVC